MSKRMRITVEDDNGNLLVDHIKIMRAIKHSAVSRVHTRWMNYYQQRYAGRWKRICIEPAESLT